MLMQLGSGPSLLPAGWCLGIVGRYLHLLHGLPQQSNSSYVRLLGKGTRRGIRRGKIAARSEHLRAVVRSGAGGVPPGRSGVVPWVPRLLLYSAPSPATPIDAVNGVSQVVPVPFPVSPPWVDEPAGRCSVQLDTRKI